MIRATSLGPQNKSHPATAILSVRSLRCLSFPPRSLPLFAHPSSSSSAAPLSAPSATAHKYSPPPFQSPSWKQNPVPHSSFQTSVYSQISFSTVLHPPHPSDHPPAWASYSLYSDHHDCTGSSKIFSLFSVKMVFPTGICHTPRRRNRRTWRASAGPRGSFGLRGF